MAKGKVIRDYRERRPGEDFLSPLNQPTAAVFRNKSRRLAPERFNLKEANERLAKLLEYRGFA